MTNATEWAWVAVRVDGLGDMIAEACDVEGGTAFRRRLLMDIRQEKPGQFSLHIERHPDHDLMMKIAPEIAVPSERIVFMGVAEPKAVEMAEQALGEGKRIVPATVREIAKAANIFRGPNGG